ncbi:MAG: DUF2783 domain-containing protein [Rhizobacter sp.]
MLNTEPNLESPDDFYEALMEAHGGLSTAQSHVLNAKLVLLLASHIGSLGVLREALALARANTAAGVALADASTIGSTHPERT